MVPLKARETAAAAFLDTTATSVADLPPDKHD